MFLSGLLCPAHGSLLSGIVPKSNQKGLENLMLLALLILPAPRQSLDQRS